MRRPISLTSGSIHHIYSKSIADYIIFSSHTEYERFVFLLNYYRHITQKPFSQLARLQKEDKTLKIAIDQATQNASRKVDILSYCIMPTHFHLILLQRTDLGIQQFISDICNSYTNYFNKRHNRKGPLWQNRFGNSRIETTQELLHTSRYVHLNPTTAYLTDHPTDWPYSSFNEYLSHSNAPTLCQTGTILKHMGTDKYKHFVIDHINEQRQNKKPK